MKKTSSRNPRSAKIWLACACAVVGLGVAVVGIHAAGWKPKVGETIVYEMKMFHVTLATQTMKVEEITKRNGTQCYRVTSSTRNVPLAAKVMEIDDVNESCITMDKLIPVYYKSKIRETGWKSDNVTLYKPKNIVIDEIRGEKLDEKRHTDLKAGLGVLDDVSIVYNLRGREMKVGDVFNVKVLSDREIQNAKVEVLRRVEIKTALGKRPAFIVKSSFSDSMFWLEDSPERIPLKFEVKTKAGRSQGAIKSYTPGK